MDQRAPRTASFATTVAVMSFIAMIGNAFLGNILVKKVNVSFSNRCSVDF